MTEVDIAGNKYQVGRMPPLKQFHVSRKLAPLAFAFGAGLVSNANISSALSKTPESPAVDALEGSEEPDLLKDVAGKDILTAFEPVTLMLAQMREEDLDYVFKTCLGYAKRQQGSAWAAVQTPSGQMMFDDIDMTIMMQITMEVVKENKLANFITAQL